MQEEPDAMISEEAYLCTDVCVQAYTGGVAAMMLLASYLRHSRNGFVFLTAHLYLCLTSIAADERRKKRREEHGKPNSQVIRTTPSTDTL